MYLLAVQARNLFLYWFNRSGPMS